MESILDVAVFSKCGFLKDHHVWQMLHTIVVAQSSKNPEAQLNIISVQNKEGLKYTVHELIVINSTSTTSSRQM